jgi:purine-binding chemotaxis protein CheW
MSFSGTTAAAEPAAVDIIAFHLHGQQFCLETKTIREIRGWAPCTPLPRAPAEMLGVMNLRGSVIPIIDLAGKLGMMTTAGDERSAIVVVEVHGAAIGLVVDRVSDILTVSRERIQPVPALAGHQAVRYAEGIITHDAGMICFLDLSKIFESAVRLPEAA